MSQRYKRILSIENRSWNSACPIILEKGALLSDNVQGCNVLQLQFYYTCDKKIKGFKICIDLFSISKEKIRTDEFQYLDIKVGNNTSFGSNIPLNISNTNARYFIFKIVEIVFEDEEVMTGTWILSKVENVEPASKLGNLQSVLKIPYSSGMYIPKNYDDYWLCGCGAINRIDSHNCINCKIAKDELFSAFTIDKLNNDYQDKIANELMVQQKRKRKNKHFLIGTLVVIAIILASFIPIWKFVVVPYECRKEYRKNAKEAFEENKYDIAYNLFKQAGDDVDSTFIQYIDQYFEQDRYDEGIMLLKYVSESKVKEVLPKYNDMFFDNAVAALQNNKTLEADNFFNRISDKDNYLLNHIDVFCNKFNEAYENKDTKQMRLWLRYVSEILPSKGEELSNKCDQFCYDCSIESMKNDKIETSIEYYQKINDVNLKTDIENNWLKKAIDYFNSGAYDKSAKYLVNLRHYKEARKYEKYIQIKNELSSGGKLSSNIIKDYGTGKLDTSVFNDNELKVLEKASENFGILKGAWKDNYYYYRFKNYSMYFGDENSCSDYNLEYYVNKECWVTNLTEFHIFDNNTLYNNYSTDKFKRINVSELPSSFDTIK